MVLLREEDYENSMSVCLRIKCMLTQLKNVLMILKSIICYLYIVSNSLRTILTMT